jgi:putative sigma-54 modulation protein
MNKIAIPLGEPLEILIQRALALPNGGIDDDNVVKMMRYVYQLAHGRFVETLIGRIPIAPPIVPDLATARIYAATRSELLSLLKRMIVPTFAGREQLERADSVTPSALVEFLDRQLGAPEFGPNGCLGLKPTRLFPSTSQPRRKRTMKNLTVHITPHDLKLSTSLREFVRRKIIGVSRFSADLISAEIVLRRASGAAHLFSVSARLALPGRDVQANAAHPNLYGAINKLVARLGRLSRKRKTRLAKIFRRAQSSRSFAGI